jgi:phenylalanyl-tRNA synthetase beta subunit
LNWDISFSKGKKEEFHPGRYANILNGDKEIGFMGEIHPIITKKFGIKTKPLCLRSQNHLGWLR